MWCRYVEFANGNAQQAIGLYFDGVELPFGGSPGSPHSGNNASSLLLPPNSSRGSDVHGGGGSRPSSRGGRGDGADASSPTSAMSGSARFMQYLQEIISSAQASSRQTLQLRNGGGGGPDDPPMKVISGGPLHGLGAADCFRCIGYFLGKAILERQTIPAYLADYILRHLVGSPVGLNDLRQLDPGMYGVFFDAIVEKGKQSQTSRQSFDFEEAGLDFSVEVLDNSSSGGVRTVDLKPGGRDIPVNDENKYVAALRCRGTVLRMSVVACMCCRPEWHIELVVFAVQV